MTLDAVVKDDGTLIAKAPKSFWGQQLKIEILTEGDNTHAPRKKSSQWEKMKQALQDIDALNLPEREFADILAELRTFKDTL